MKFLLRAFKYYYPCCLASLLVFENPTVLNASWKLVRSWMDAEMQHIFHHVTRASLPDLVPFECLPLHMGGKVRLYSLFFRSRQSIFIVFVNALMLTNIIVYLMRSTDHSNKHAHYR
ncbi:unnamed protein product [Toxocara canis]|uniref:CRAL-TRIO domain-containing protein n=1 Tax=Toxocara canis TaxID=6265 RepID=A0A183TZ15_TOXCA|nr:unnamed protein product [Toxocara canis]